MNVIKLQANNCRRAAQQLNWWPLATIIAGALWFSPLSIEISTASDGATIRVESPSQGLPPRPTVPADSQQHRSDIIPELEVDVDDSLGTDVESAGTDVESAGTDSLAEIITDNLDQAPLDDAADQAEDTSDASSEFLAEISGDAQTNDTADNNLIRSLSVEPGTHTLLPPDRPAWVGSEPDFSGDVHRFYVESIPVANKEKVDAALEQSLMNSVLRYVDGEVLGEWGAAKTWGSHLPIFVETSSMTPMVTWPRSPPAKGRCTRNGSRLKRLPHSESS